MEEPNPPEKRNIDTEGGNYNERIEGNYIQDNVQFFFNFPAIPKAVSIVVFIGCAGFLTVVQTVIQHYFPSLGSNLVKNPLSIEGKSQWENLINVQENFDSTKPNAFCTYQTNQSQGWRGIKSKPIEIQADKSYNFGALLSWKDAVNVHVAIEWQNKSHIELDRPQKYFGSGNSNGWISGYQTFTSPPNAAFAVLHIWHGMLPNKKSVPKSTLCIDHIQFSQS